jgi:DNA-binding transcriptional ArsR family regulator
MNPTTRKKAAARNSAVTDLGAIVSHPTRRRVWSALYGRIMSPRELADELGQTTEHVSYHVSELRNMGVIELVGKRKVRGATQHFYRVTERYHLDEQQVAALSPEESTANLIHIFQLEFADITAGLDSGKMVERTAHTVQRHPFVLDEEGWAEVYDLCEEFGERIDAAQAKAAERTMEDPATRSIHGTVHINFFEMPDREDRLKQF